MNKKRYCKYCGCKTHNKDSLCNECAGKLILIRKIRAILLGIKQSAKGADCQ